MEGSGSIDLSEDVSSTPRKTKMTHSKKQKRTEQEPDNISPKKKVKTSSKPKPNHSRKRNIYPVVDETKIKDYFDPIKESLRFLKIEKKRKRQRDKGDSESEDELLAIIDEDSYEESEEDVEVRQKNSNMHYVSADEEEYLKRSFVEYDYQEVQSVPEKNPPVKILDNRVQKGNYEYYLEKKDGSKEWRHSNFCMDYISLVCDYLSSRMVVEKASEEERKKSGDIDTNNKIIGQTSQVLSKTQQVQSKTQQVQNKAQQVQNKSQQVQSKSQQAQSKTQQVQSKTQQVQSKTQQVQNKAQQVQNKSQQVQNKSQQAQSKTQQIQSKAKQVQSKTQQAQINSQVQSKSQQAQSKTQQVQSNSKICRRRERRLIINEFQKFVAPSVFEHNTQEKTQENTQIRRRSTMRLTVQKRSEGSFEYYPEKIVSKKGAGDKVHYHIKWLGKELDNSRDSWLTPLQLKRHSLVADKLILDFELPNNPSFSLPETRVIKQQTLLLPKLGSNGKQTKEKEPFTRFWERFENQNKS